MSAYIVSDETITAIVQGAVELLSRDYSFDPLWLGQLLVDENYRSVNYRYDEDTKPHKYEWKELKKWDYGVLLGCIRCYIYQSCETDDWKDTEAYSWISRLRTYLLDALVDTLGYEMPWGI